MRELANFAEEHNLRSLALELVKQNETNVVGVALGYTRDVTYAARSKMPSWLRTFEVLGSITRSPKSRTSKTGALNVFSAKHRALVWNSYWRDAFANAVTECRRHGEPLFELIICQKRHSPKPKVDSLSALNNLREELRIRFEERSVPILQRRAADQPACGVGSRVSPTDSPNLHGTVGGIARDRTSGRIFAMTAAHVFNGELGQSVELGAPREQGPWYRAIATWGKRRTEEPGTLFASSPINAWVGSQARTVILDAANVDTCIILPQNADLNVQRLRVRSLHDVTFGEMLTFSGATSGIVTARLGPYNLAFSFRDFTGRQRMYEDLVDLRFGEAGPRRSPSRGGDSGAWVLTDDGDWYASILGADHLTSFCTRADMTVRYWSGKGTVLE